MKITLLSIVLIKFFLYQLFSRCVKQELAAQKMEMSTYMTLFTPALDFILQAVAANASENLFTELLDRCSKQGNR